MEIGCDIGLESLGKLAFLRSYSKNGEDYTGTVNRYLQFMIDMYPTMKSQILGYGQAIYDKQCVGSMRGMQFAGEPIKNENARVFNCSFLGISATKDFADACYLLAVGCGVGISVEPHYVDQLPITAEGHEETFVIQDCKESWSDSIQQLIENCKVKFDYSLIRPAGAPLSSGGSASGPLPLVKAHEAIRAILRPGRKLRPIDVADIVCHTAQAIISGGSRRSAIIVLYCSQDTEMSNFKGEGWWDNNIQRSQANISALCLRGSEDVGIAIDRLLASPYGEPGLVLTSNFDYSQDIGGNPCLEISLRSRQMCNLSEIILPNCRSESDFLFACRAASFFGTLQAGLTDFHYIDKRWSETTKEDGLLGVSLTGTAQIPKFITANVLREGAQTVVNQNIATAKKIGINPAKRLTCVKPSGTTSCVFSTTSGVHAAHSEYVIRRVRVNKASPLGQKLTATYGCSASMTVTNELGTSKLPVDPYHFICEEAFNDYDLCLQFPCHYTNAIYKEDESAVELLDRASWYKENWINPGHLDGQETHNVSLTVTYKPEEREAVKGWMLANQDKYRGISVLPDDASAYPLLPFQAVTKEEFTKFKANFPKLDWEALGVKGEAHKTVACSGGSSCEFA